MANFIRPSVNTTLETVVEEKVIAPVEAIKTPINSFVMVKNYRGGFGVSLEPWDFSAPARSIRFRFDQEQQHVPTKWALGIFVSPLAVKLLEEGYYTFENLHVLIKMAEDLGLYVPDSIKEPKINLKELKNALLKNDLATIKRLMMNASKKLVADFIVLARQNHSMLSIAMVTFIESTYKVSLETITLNE
jgi:hypothetical protein